MREKICVKCGRLVVTTGQGRPPSYCSVVCRRAAGLEISRISRRLERLEDQLAAERRDAGDPTVGLADIMRDEMGRNSAQRVAHFEQEIARAEARLRCLLEE
jgi:hypothetical protein